MDRAFKSGDVVDIGGYLEPDQPRITECYVIVDEPVGKYAKVCQLDGPSKEVHTVYMGRWFTKNTEA